MSLAEAAEARQLTCDDVRRELAEIAEGLKKGNPGAAPSHARVRGLPRVPQALRKTNTAMALAFPVGPLLILKKLALAKLGSAALSRWRRRRGDGRAAPGAAGATGAATGRPELRAGRRPAAGGRRDRRRGRPRERRGLGLGAVATKAAAGVAVTALFAGGAVEAKRVAAPSRPSPVSAPAAASPRRRSTLPAESRWRGRPRRWSSQAQQAADEAEAIDRGERHRPAGDRHRDDRRLRGGPGDAARSRPPRRRTARTAPGRQRGEQDVQTGGAAGAAELRRERPARRAARGVTGSPERRPRRARQPRPPGPSISPLGAEAEAAEGALQDPLVADPRGR